MGSILFPDPPKRKRGRPPKLKTGPSAATLLRQESPESQANRPNASQAAGLDRLVAVRDTYGRPRGSTAVASKNKKAHEERMQELRDRNNEPFLRLLSALIAAEPTAAKLREWAKRKPNEWMAAVVNLSRVVGYGNERIAAQTNIINQISLASDADLQKMAISLTQPAHGDAVDGQKVLEAKKVVDIEPDNVQTD